MNNTVQTNDIMAMMRNPVFTPLKEGKYKCKIEKVGINADPQAMNLPDGYYMKNQPAGKNNNYFRLDLVTSEGKRINRNVFPENVNVVVSNIKRQLDIEEDMSTFEVLNKCLTEGCELDMWVWYNDKNKNVDFYDAISAKEASEAEVEQAIAAL